MFRAFHYNARIAHLDHEFEVQIQFFSELPNLNPQQEFITSQFLRPGIANRKQKKQIPGDFSEFREDLTWSCIFFLPLHSLESPRAVRAIL